MTLALIYLSIAYLIAVWPGNFNSHNEAERIYISALWLPLIVLLLIAKLYWVCCDNVRIREMKQVFKKFICLYWFILSAYEDWRINVWKQDLDELYCCDGRDCLCGGATIEQTYMERER